MDAAVLNLLNCGFLSTNLSLIKQHVAPLSTNTTASFPPIIARNLRREEAEGVGALAAPNCWEERLFPMRLSWGTEREEGGEEDDTECDVVCPTDCQSGLARVGLSGNFVPTWKDDEEEGNSCEQCDLVSCISSTTVVPYIV